MTCTPREDTGQTAYSQSLVSRLYESLLDTLWIDRDQKVKRTATLIRMWGCAVWFSLASGVCWRMKDSILGMLNALIRVYINFGFRLANRWLENSFRSIFSTWLVLITTSFNTFVLKYLSEKPFILPYSHKRILEFITFAVAYFDTETISRNKSFVWYVQLLSPSN